ncbi:hypothetical protein HYU93_00365 [Candidatus Daviesbacteria bacterium]|nr:hypothetical protein [Candidatus Daviesbacteria bacterium]
MTENQRVETNTTRHSPSQENNNTVVLRVPKPNLQIVVLGLIAVITLFQTFQLVRISSKASATPVKVAPATTSGGVGTGSNADVPQSMVGGC